jgi:hypothetical protein
LLFVGDLDSDETVMVYAARQKMAALSSCFAQLTHKAQTVFQNSAKVEVSVCIMNFMCVSEVIISLMPQHIKRSTQTVLLCV